LILNFDPSDVEEYEEEGNQNVEEEVDAIDDVMVTDNLDLLQKFYLTSAELKDDKNFREEKD